MDEPIEKDDKVLSSTSKVELNIKAEPYNSFNITIKIVINISQRTCKKHILYDNYQN